MGIIEWVLWQVVRRQSGQRRVQRRRIRHIGVIDCAVVIQQLRSAVAGIMRVRKPKPDQKWPNILFGVSMTQIVQHLLSMPGAATFFSPLTFGGIATHSELAIGSFIAVALFTGTHGGVASVIEDGGQRLAR